ncbi:hypothetical protein DPQ25_06715 [Hydrogeniiclostridium mannosilyticum]|uniref:Uncharacterized protein n=1 Tax=Hydrogeniiclostridium mannosilyticum TaxID=2764322 RepID=A0A328UC87_9FIRM|nr:hypothetical protein [Hydrogeniiclostridium mannosilyticum]RAQ29176.1 hypothetical protein DPQ25_06715 [Hydrogeniiclostridium mannosilyticum]
MIALNLELVRGLQARLYALIKNIPANTRRFVIHTWIACKQPVWREKRLYKVFVASAKICKIGLVLGINLGAGSIALSWLED